MGVDLADGLSIAVFFGYLALGTFPMGATLLGIWLFAAVIVTLVWWLRRRGGPTSVPAKEAFEGITRF